ncbi:MAG: hypothetical protein JST83_13700 [Bacteroidetes bacterium]|nr:hypothetical protein [Bacteroidota bacterium]
MNRFYQHYYQYQYLEARDLFLVPLFIVLIYAVANSFVKRKIRKDLRKYFIPALSLKMFGALASGLVYQYYYRGGDTMEFYTSASYIYSLFWSKPLDAIHMFSASPVWTHPELAQYDYLPFIYDVTTWTIVRITALVNLFSFDSYPVISLYFSIFSLYCSWKFFSLLADLYPDPKLIQRFAYCLFYIPSVFFWGSGVFKDTLTLGGLFLVSYNVYEIFIRRNLAVNQILSLILGLYLMYSIRLFFLIILIPCIGFWLFAEFRDKIIKNETLKTVSFPLLLAISSMVIIFGVGRAMSADESLSAEALQHKAEGFQSWHGSLGGSAYDLGITDYTTSSLIQVFPKAINVTLFRPYLTEAHSGFQLITALQSLFFLLYLLYTLAVARLAGISAITKDPLILFSLTFSLFYAFVAGFTSYNFGALDRYKIPALPFFMLALVLVNYHAQRRKSRVKTS